ncbi:hypothetical protein CI266_004661 [Salmonella enterica subsp. enterica serovar Kotte]|nr:hypothetical protein [Salmonella enterica subsp. enterica serovar Kotte]
MDKINEESFRLIKEADEKEAQWAILKIPRRLIKVTFTLVLLSIPVLICASIYHIYEMMGEIVLYLFALILIFFTLAFIHESQQKKQGEIMINNNIVQLSNDIMAVAQKKQATNDELMAAMTVLLVNLIEKTGNDGFVLNSESRTVTITIENRSAPVQEKLH